MISMPKTVAIATIAVSVLATCLATSTAAGAELDDTRLAQAPEVLVIDADSAETSSKKPGEVFYPTGALSANTIVVMPEVYEQYGLTADDMAGVDTQAELMGALSAARASCGGVATGAYGVWSAPSVSPVSVAGNPNYKQDYTWWVQDGTNQSAGVQGLGYYRGYNGSQLGTWSKWYGVGVGTSGSALVPWGNVWSIPQLRAKSTITVHIAQVSWEC